MGARPGYAIEPLIPFKVQKMDFMPNKALSSINDDFKRGCVMGEHSFKHGDLNTIHDDCVREKSL